MTTDTDSATPLVLTINGGSSSIKFASFTFESSPQPYVRGAVDRIGSAGSRLAVRDGGGEQDEPVDVEAPDHRAAASHIMEWFERRLGERSLAGIGHRIVHGGPDHHRPTRVTPRLLGELRHLAPFVPNHLPTELDLIEAFAERFPGVPQVACFDTGFHHDLPDVARALPLPRRYEEQGMRRYGFHGLSYQFLMEELQRSAGPEAASGRVILAHLGNGASLAAVHRGKPIETTMGFTPSGGLVMGTRCGDLDPGALVYLARTQGLTPDELERLTSRESGLLGLSETSSDMRDLLSREGDDPRAALAVAVFCHQAKKWIGALAAALGGLDTLVFSGGIGEHAAPVRARICEGLEHLGLRIDPQRNAVNAEVISPESERLAVRVIATDEQIIIARAIHRLLAPDDGADV